MFLHERFGPFYSLSQTVVIFLLFVIDGKKELYYMHINAVNKKITIRLSQKLTLCRK